MLIDLLARAFVEGERERETECVRYDKERQVRMINLDYHIVYTALS